MKEQELPLSKPNKEEVVAYMLENDAFSRWLGLEIKEIRAGYVCLQGKIRPEMMNGIGTLHGGVTFAMADSAFAFACNMDNRKSVALDLSISFTHAGYQGDVFTVVCQEINSTRKTGLYEVKIHNQNNQLIALFKATTYRLDVPVIPLTP